MHPPPTLQRRQRGPALSIIISTPHALAGRHLEATRANLSSHSFPSPIRLQPKGVSRRGQGRLAYLVGRRQEAVGSVPARACPLRLRSGRALSGVEGASSSRYRQRLTASLRTAIPLNGDGDHAAGRASSEVSISEISRRNHPGRGDWNVRCGRRLRPAGTPREKTRRICVDGYRGMFVMCS